MKLERKWAWPTRWPTTKNSKTKIQGSIGQIYRLVKGYTGDGKGWVDPFCGRSTLCALRNDIRKTGTTAHTHLDALEFLRSLPSDSFAGVVYDPPYNDAQAVKYTTKFHTFSDLKYWWNMRKEISRVLRGGGLCVMLNWNSNIISECDIEEVYLFAHGSERHDTIVSIQRKKLKLKL